MDDANDLLQLIKNLRERRPETAPIWLAKRKLAAELRRLSNTLCDSEAIEEDILALAELIREKAAFLQPPERRESQGGAAAAIVPGMETFYDRGPPPITPPSWRASDASR